MRGHRQLEHTADLALALWAPDEAQLYEEAALATVALITEGAPVHGSETREVHLDASDSEARLVGWINEVIFWAVTEGFLVRQAKLQVVPQGLRGQVWGAFLPELVLTELKSATYHQLQIGPQDGAWHAQVVIDI